MSWPHPPQISKRAIDKAGRLLAFPSQFIGEAEDARRRLSEWRTAHLWPLHRGATDLIDRLQRLNIHAIVAMRLKRLFRIVAKLEIFENMDVSRMQDIAGIRVIVPSIHDVDALVADILRTQLECADVTKVDDYIEAPKDNGYRSIHLVLRHKEPESKYDGLLLELQIRTEAEHAWASSVEVNGITSGYHIKYDEGQPEWRRFFQLGAELVARSEGKTSLEDLDGVNHGELISELNEIESNLKAFDTMLSHRVRNHRDLPKLKASTDAMGACFLFEFAKDPMNPDITVFDANEQEDAILRYAGAEQMLDFEEGKLAPILVSVSSVDKLPVAYQTFFLDCSPYVELLRKLIGGSDAET